MIATAIKSIARNSRAGSRLSLGTFCAALTSLAVALATCLVTTPRAQAADDFYKGKTLRILIGYGAGGGYDLYGRVFAEQITNYLPGHPTVVVQNMPGAGSFVAAKYLYSVAPKDGTYFGIISQTFALDAMMNEDETNFDASKLPIIGRLAESVDVGTGRPGAKFKNIDDVRQHEIVVASTGGSSPGFLMPAALAKYGGAKLKIISGYAGSNEAELALQRGEADLAASVALLSIQQKYPDWLKEDGGASILYVSGLKRSPIIPWVPSLAELGTSEAGTKVLRAIGASAEIGKFILTTPGVPADRLATLRKAFMDMVSDKAFLDTMAQRQIPISAASGEDMDKVVLEVKNTPPQVIAMLRDLVKPSEALPSK